MNVIPLIRSILTNYHSVPQKLEIRINGKDYSFFSMVSALLIVINYQRINIS